MEGWHRPQGTRFHRPNPPRNSICAVFFLIIYLPSFLQRALTLSWLFSARLALAMRLPRRIDFNRLQSTLTTPPDCERRGLLPVPW